MPDRGGGTRHGNRRRHRIKSAGCAPTSERGRGSLDRPPGEQVQRKACVFEVTGFAFLAG
eukprot:1295003-Prorocentrum_lima.AAC.1